MIKCKLETVAGVSITLAVIGVIMLFSAYKVKEQRLRCERCAKLEFAIEQVLTIILEDNTDYYLDVLSETDEYYNLYELLNEDCNIDSTRHRPRNVFPDLPAKQAPQWKLEHNTQDTTRLIPF